MDFLGVPCFAAVDHDFLLKSSLPDDICLDFVIAAYFNPIDKAL